MAILCAFTSLVSAQGCPIGGIAAVKVIPRTNIVIATMQAATATYLDVPTYNFILAPPKTVGAAWVKLEFDGTGNPTRTAKVVSKKNKAEIAIGELRFNGAIATRKIEEYRKCCHWAVATLYNDGTIYIDGIEVDQSDDTFLTSPRYGGLTMGDFSHTSEDGDNGNPHTNSFSIVGTTAHGGYLYTGTWASLV